MGRPVKILLEKLDLLSQGAEEYDKLSG